MSTVISASCEDVFDVVSDLSRRPAFTDHYMKDFRLARSNPVGSGASARFLLNRRLFSERAEVRITDCERPRRMAEEGRIGRRGRSTLAVAYELEAADGGCRIEVATSSEPKTAVDRFRQRGLQRWVRRSTKKSLDRLRRLLEEPDAEVGERVTVAGYEPHTAPRFGDHVRAPRKMAAPGG